MNNGEYHQNRNETSDFHLQMWNFYNSKISKLLEFRYQIAIIIIPTILGLWGFIGIIITSKLFSKNPYSILFGTYFGIILSIFLIYMWRTRVYDLFIEEITVNIWLAKFEKIIMFEDSDIPPTKIWKYLPHFNQLKLSTIRKIYPKSKLKEDEYLLELFADFDEKLKQQIKKPFDSEEFKTLIKMYDSGFEDMEKWVSGVILGFGIVGIVVSIYFCNQLFLLALLVSSIIVIVSLYKFEKLRNKIILTPPEFNMIHDMIPNKETFDKSFS